MKYLAPKLKHRVQILKVVETPGRGFGINEEYQRLIRIWSQIIPKKLTNTQGGPMPVRTGSDDEVDIVTHEFVVRHSSVISKYSHAFNEGYDEGYVVNNSQGMGREYSIAFAIAFDSITDINPIKANYYIFHEAGRQDRGRLFKILRVVRDDNLKEYISILCQELEEQGTGGRFNER
jgi:hypothetical protein